MQRSQRIYSTTYTSERPDHGRSRSSSRGSNGGSGESRDVHTGGYSQVTRTTTVTRYKVDSASLTSKPRRSAPLNSGSNPTSGPTRQSNSGNRRAPSQWEYGRRPGERSTAFTDDAKPCGRPTDLGGPARSPASSPGGVGTRAAPTHNNNELGQSGHGSSSRGGLEWSHSEQVFYDPNLVIVVEDK